MKIRAYNQKDLSKEKNGPDQVHYETVRDRVSKDKYIEVFFFTRKKNNEQRSIFLPYDLSRKIIKALEIYDSIMSGDIKILQNEKNIAVEEDEEQEEKPVKVIEKKTPAKKVVKTTKPKPAPKKVAKK